LDTRNKIMSDDDLIKFMKQRFDGICQGSMELLSGRELANMTRNKDRLLRFGFELIENLCTKYGTTIEIIDSTDKTEEQELVEDLVQIVTVVSCRLQGKRAHKAKKMIKELLENDIGEES